MGMQESKFKGYLIGQANLIPGQQILNLGCGTGTLTLMIKHVQPKAEVVGLDADPEILAIAKAKAEQNRVKLNFQQGCPLIFSFQISISIMYSLASFSTI